MTMVQRWNLPRILDTRIVPILLIAVLGLSAVSGLSAQPGPNGMLAKLAAERAVRLKASFSFGPAIPTTGDAVQFTDTSAGAPTAWQWDFGDGSASTAQHPVHSYAAAGFYRVILTVANGSGSRAARRTVTVVSRSTLFPSFAYSPNYPGVGQIVQFVDTSTGGPDSWQWDFGDGETSRSKNPTHVYRARGFYTVALTVGSGAVYRSAKHTVTVAMASTMAASFGYSPVSPVVGQTVTFTDASTGAPTSWSWSFGDGGTSSSQNPTHVYTGPGTYTATLTVADGTRTNTTTRTVTVTAAPVAAFSYSPASPIAGQAVTVYGHLDGYADLVVVELRGRRDERDPQSQPRLRGGRVLYGEPDRDQRSGIECDDADGDGDGGAGGVVQLQPGIPDRGTGRDVHGHLDGDADLVVVELRGRRDEHDPQPQPHVHGGRVLYGKPDRDQRSGIEFGHPDGHGDGGAGGVVQL